MAGKLRVALGVDAPGATRALLAGEAAELDKVGADRGRPGARGKSQRSGGLMRRRNLQQRGGVRKRARESGRAPGILRDCTPNVSHRCKPTREMMIQSVLYGDVQRPAEMPGPR